MSFKLSLSGLIAYGLMAAGVCLLLGMLAAAVNALAAPGEAPLGQPAARPLPAQLSDNHPPFSDDACLLCHTDTDATITFPSGEVKPVQVDTAVLAASVHGSMAESPLACQACHQPPNDYQFPHTPLTTATLRAYDIARSETCERCHAQSHLTSHPGPQSDNPVVCTDCHNSHDVQPAESWHSGASEENCTACHEAQGVAVSPEMTTAVIQSGLFAAQKKDNAYCLACHSQPGQTMTFANGDQVSITVDAAALHDSVHGANNKWDALQCTDCHQAYDFPHAPVTAVTGRQYSLNQDNLCQRCHEVQFAKALSSVHSAALLEGNLESALCSDCHSAHTMPKPDEPRSRINETCRQCHSTIYDDYVESVHGAALTTEGNPDVPSCVNCHGVHNIQDPTTAEFRINSPTLCATCHADKALMAQYEISTDVFETYVADFHGTTDLLFVSAGVEGAQLNEAVCYDCHGIHNIKAPDDPQAGIKQNLLETCQQCHPDATANFPASWTSHYKPSLQHNTLVYLIELFYSIVIPVTLGFFGFLVVVDVYGRMRRYRQANR